MKINRYLQYYDYGQLEVIQRQLVGSWKLTKEPATSTFRVAKMKTEAAGSSTAYLPNNKTSFNWFIFYWMMPSITQTTHYWMTKRQQKVCGRKQSWYFPSHSMEGMRKPRNTSERATTLDKILN